MSDLATEKDGNWLLFRVTCTVHDFPSLPKLLSQFQELNTLEKKDVD